MATTLIHDDLVLEQLNNERLRLQNEFKSLDNQLTLIRKRLTIITSVTEKYEYEHQAEDIIDRQNEASDKIRAIEQRILDAQDVRLFQSVSRIDYVDQFEVFKSCLEIGPKFGAFIIHGSPKHGQYLLLHRLLNYRPQFACTEPFVISFARRSMQNSVDEVWREIARNLHISTSSSPLQIVNALIKRWRAETVLIVIKSVREVPIEVVRSVMLDFWRTIAERASKEACNESFDHWLLLFVIDDAGNAVDWDIPFAGPTMQTRNSMLPVLLPEIRCFSADILIGWASSGVIDDYVIRSHVTRHIRTETGAVIEATSAGVPEDVLEYICQICDSNWYGGVDKCLKF